MKSSSAIESKIKKLRTDLARVRARDREQRLARLLSALDRSGLADDEAVAAIEAAAKSKAGVQP